MKDNINDIATESTGTSSTHIPKGSVVVCSRCYVEPVKHEVIEKQEYETVLHLKEMKPATRKALPRKVTTGMHCPKCFLHNGFIYVLGNMVKEFKVNKLRFKD